MNAPSDPTPSTAVSGFVLAGGRSSRFGSNKVLAEWNGRPLLDYSLQGLRDAGIDPRVVTPDPLPLQHLARNFVTGEIPNRGPVEAVRVALEAAPTPWSLILTADMPEAPPLIPALLDLLADWDPEGANLICFRDAEGWIQPFPGLYHHSLLDLWGNLGSRQSMNALVEVARSRPVSVTSDPGLSGKTGLFRNVNEHRDLDNLPASPADPESD